MGQKQEHTRAITVPRMTTDPLAIGMMQAVKSGLPHPLQPLARRRQPKAPRATLQEPCLQRELYSPTFLKGVA